MQGIKVGQLHQGLAAFIFSHHIIVIVVVISVRGCFGLEQTVLVEVVLDIVHKPEVVVVVADVHDFGLLQRRRIVTLVHQLFAPDPVGVLETYDRRYHLFL